jgi:uncharacterized cupin superfamily protein
MAQQDRPELLRAADSAAKMGKHAHPWNPNSEMTGVMLSRLTGLERTAVNLARIAPGKESFVYHAHAREEEWLYILSGTGTMKSVPATSWAFRPRRSPTICAIPASRISSI